MNGSLYTVSPGLCIVHEISPGHESVVTETFTLSWLLEQLVVGLGVGGVGVGTFVGLPVQKSGFGLE